ncbi:hypothetical protein [Piscinibacter koreensis]|uniref:Uncharacterized protein n=1 Tax=Piscinibacter koreensis TaxID=2742824 RepID=A0A7Y6NSC0_9BURK|nr:hypothetical protein [Schlegelella koreensis]NUZ08430.1 hypothetical protein [Schlegelella koreensis]
MAEIGCQGRYRGEVASAGVCQVRRQVMGRAVVRISRPNSHFVPDLGQVTGVGLGGAVNLARDRGADNRQECAEHKSKHPTLKGTPSKLMQHGSASARVYLFFANHRSSWLISFC